MNIQNVYQDLNIKMVRGDTLEFYVEFDDLESALSSASFTCRDTWDGAVKFQATLNNGITVDSGDANVYDVHILPNKTSSLDWGTYVYDLQIGVGSDIYTLIKGKLYLTEDATYS